jgi:hypothetical protein
MILAKLVLAHIIGDFFLQPKSWVESKTRKKWLSPYLYVHGFIHFALIIAVFWDFSVWDAALTVAAAHALIDGVKLQFQKPTNAGRWFAADQVLHLLTLMAVWYLFWGNGLELPDENFWIVIAGLLLVTFPASTMVQRTMSRWADEIETENEGSLEGAGQYIGILERLLIYIAIIGGHPQIIGFLLAAKSVFRFGDLTRSKDRKLTEYILTGTLLSFLVAIVAGMIVLYFTGREFG